MNQRIKDIVNKHFSFDDEDIQVPKKKLDVNKIVQQHKDIQWVNENFVDLNLPSGTLWCKFNLGAICGNNPESWYGNYYAWGETNPKDSYRPETYSMLDDTKIPTTRKYGNIDNMRYLQESDDAAYKTNPLCCIPSEEDWNELLQNASWNWEADYNGVSGLNGYTLTSVHNKAELFFPATGYKIDEHVTDLAKAFIWTSTLCSHSQQWAKTMRFELNKLNIGDLARTCGASIRPISKR